MNASLIEKIKNLITEAKVGFSAGDSAALNSAFPAGGGFSMSGGGKQGRNKDYRMLARRAAQSAARTRLEQSVRASFRKLGGRNGATKRLIYSYNGGEDTRDWQPTISPFESNKFGDTTFWVTEQTKSFLSRLMDLLSRQEKESGPGSTTLTNHIKDLSVETSVVETSAKEKHADMKSVFDSLDISDKNQVLHLYNLIQKDKRFNRPSYMIKISAPIEKYSQEDIKNIQDNLVGMNPEFKSNLRPDAVMAYINDSRINVEIRITADTTLLPLYNKVGFVPLSSKVGALDKMAWSYQKMQEFNRTSYFNILKTKQKKLEALKRKPKSPETDSEINEIQADIDQLNGVINKYNSPVSFNDYETSDVMSMGPLALLAKAKSLINENAAIAITSVDDVCYFYYTTYDGNGNHIEKLTTFNSAKPYGNALKNYFEGVITKQEYDSIYEKLSDEQKKKAEPIQLFLKGRYTPNIYCMKMMFCDWVNLQYRMRLPTTPADTSIGGPGNMQFKMPDSISVPGAQLLNNSNTVVRKVVNDLKSKANNYLVTTATNVLHKGTGSMSFLQGIYDLLINKYRVESNYTDVTLLISIMNSLIGGFYAIVDRKEFDNLKNTGSANSMDSTTISVADNQELIDFLISLKRPRPSDYQMIPKFDKSNHESLVDCLEYFTKMCSQLIKRMSDVLIPSSRSMKSKMESAINFPNAAVAGFPTLIKKIDDGIVEGINDSFTYKRTLSNCIVNLNCVQDIGAMISAFFVAFKNEIASEKAAAEAAAKSGSKKAKKPTGLFKPELVSAYDYAGLNLTQCSKGYGKVARATHVKKLVNFFLTAREEFEKKYMRSTKDEKSDPTASQTTILEFLMTVFDSAKTLRKLIGMDGIRVLEYSNLENMDEPRKGWLSRINSELTIDNFSNELNINEERNRNWVKRISKAIAETPMSTLSTGFAVDDFCREHFQPAVRMVRTALGEVGADKKIPVVITNKQSELPYVPAHTVMFATVNADGAVVLNLVSSCLKMTPEVSNYTYTYNWDDKIVETNELPRQKDMSSVYHEMARRDMAYCFLMSSSQRYMILNIIGSLNSVFKNAEESYAKLKNLVNGSSDVLNALMVGNMKLGVNRLLKTELVGENKTVEDLAMDILKFIMIHHILHVDMNED